MQMCGPFLSCRFRKYCFHHSQPLLSPWSQCKMQQRPVARPSWAVTGRGCHMSCAAWKYTQDWKDFSLRPRGFELSEHFYSLLENHSLRLSFISKIQILQNLHLNLFCTSSVPFNNRINWETQSKYFISTEESKITERDKSAEGSELLLYPCQ